MDHKQPPRPERRRLVDTAGVAVYLNDTQRHIRRLVDGRTIPHLTIGKLVRFDLDKIDRWLDEHRRPGSS